MEQNVAKNKMERNSSFELLRIICMLFILAHHYGVHTDWPGGGFGTLENLSVNTIFLQCFTIGGKWPCHVFALLTGYFTVNAQVHYKRIANLVAQMCFYGWGILLLTGIFAPQILTAKEILYAVFPFLYGNWYCVYYVLFSFFIPFVNRLIRSLSREEHKRLAVILLTVWSVVPTLTNGWNGFGSMAMLIAMYILGAYIRLYAQDSVWGRLPWKRLALLSFTLLFASALMLDVCGIITKQGVFIQHVEHFGGLKSILAVSCAVSIFMAFRQWTFYSKAVNWVSSSVLGIYLIHDNSIIKSLIWNTWSPNAEFFNSPWLVVHAFGKILVVFMVCLLIDKLREWLFDKTVTPKLSCGMSAISAWWKNGRVKQLYALF